MYQPQRLSDKLISDILLGFPALLTFGGMVNPPKRILLGEYSGIVKACGSQQCISIRGGIIPVNGRSLMDSNKQRCSNESLLLQTLSTRLALARISCLSSCCMLASSAMNMINQLRTFVDTSRFAKSISLIV